MAVRDKIWSAVLEQLVDNGSFTAEDIEKQAGVSGESLQTTLSCMEEGGWLQENTDGTWTRGDKSTELLATPA